jgi:hypothetical protein
VRPLGVHAVHPREHLYLVPERLQRLKDVREVETGPHGGRCPGIHHHPVRDVDDAKTTHRVRGRVTQCRQRGHHPVEERQSERGAEPTEHRAAGDRLLGDNHDSDLRLRNGVLCTIPTMIEDQR